MGEAPLQVIISRDAEWDLIEVAQYWEDIGEPERGEQYVADLTQEAEKLCNRPVAIAGKHPKNAEDPTVRERRVFQRVYRIIYRLDEAAARVEVLRFWHSHRDEPAV